MANVAGVSQLMETVGVPAAQTASTSGAPAQSFATVMQQANDDAGVPAAPVQQSDPKIVPQKADAQSGDKRQDADHTASDVASAPTTQEPTTVVVKSQSAVVPRVNPSHYTSANLLSALLNTGGKAAAPAVAAQSGFTHLVASSSAPAEVLKAIVGTPSTAPLPVQAEQVPEVAVRQVLAASLQTAVAVPSTAATAAESTVAPKSSASGAAVSTESKSSTRVSAATTGATAKPESVHAAVAAALPTDVPAPLTAVSVQPATSTVSSPLIANHLPPVAAETSASVPNTTTGPIMVAASATPGAVPLPPQTLKPDAPATESTPATGLATATAPAATSSATPPPATSATATATVVLPKQDATKFTPAITASPDASSPNPILASPPVAASPYSQTASVSAAPEPSTLPAKANAQPTSPSAEPLQPVAAPAPAPITATAIPQLPSTNTAPAQQQAVNQSAQSTAPAVTPVATPHKGNAKPSLSADAVLAFTPAAPQSTSAVQPTVPTGDAKDAKDTPHTAAPPAVAAAQPAAQASPASMVDPVSTVISTPIAAIHTPVALTTLSNSAGPALTGTAVTAAPGTGGDTMPHTTLSSTPTTLEVGVANGTHGWLKIRAELNASGTVDASLTGTNAAATGRLHNDLPALSSFLQDARVALGSLNVAAPSGTVSALHATVASTLEPVSAFTRSAAEAVGATGTAVASDAGTSGGRAPQGEAQPAPSSLPNQREDDGLLGAVTAPAGYGDNNDPGDTGALASGSYNGGGSWLNVRV